MLYCRALLCTGPILNLFDPKLPALRQDIRVIGDDEARRLIELGDDGEDVTRHGCCQTAAFGFRHHGIEPLLRPLGRLDRNDDGERHAAAGWRKTSNAATATSRAAAMSSSSVGRTATR